MICREANWGIRTPPNNTVISQLQAQRSCPLHSVRTRPPSLALRLRREIALFAVLDGCFFDGRGIDLREAHDAGVFVFDWRQLRILERRHGGTTWLGAACCGVSLEIWR
jgi:hypothetical protein